MDGTRFDTLARARARPATRRLLGGAYGALVLGLAGRFGAGEGRQDWAAVADAADAECAANADPAYEAACVAHRQRGASGFCVLTTAGAWRRVGAYPDCLRLSEPACAADADCTADRVCARLSGCCIEGRDGRRRCLPRYGAPETTPAPPRPTLTADERAGAQAAADAGCAAEVTPDYGAGCRFRRCPTGGYCVVNAEGAWRCVESSGYSEIPPIRCVLPGTDYNPSRCRRDDECGPGMACVRLGHCTDDPACTACMRKYFHVTQLFGDAATDRPATPISSPAAIPASAPVTHSRLAANAERDRVGVIDVAPGSCIPACARTGAAEL
jgi:hypothetical protein